MLHDHWIPIQMPPLAILHINALIKSEWITDTGIANKTMFFHVEPIQAPPAPGPHPDIHPSGPGMIEARRNC